MNNKINIIQFLPYYPPHKGGLETHAQQWGKHWYEKGYGRVYNIISDVYQTSDHKSPILFEGKIIGYIQDGVENLIAPTIEVINNFPIYKIYSPEYVRIIKYLDEKNVDRVITRTRFFLTSLIGGIYARRKKIHWCHIEHGSDYIKLQSPFKNLIGYIYDRLLGKWIFNRADSLVGVSFACRDFICSKFVDKQVDVIYRGVELPKITHNNQLKNKFPNKTIIGFVGRLYKWKNVDSLIRAYYTLDKKILDKSQLVIVGNGEDLERLKKLDTKKIVYFTGEKSGKEAVNLQDQFDIHVHSSSPGGGLATTLLQAIGLGKSIVATPYEGAKEVMQNNMNGILLDDDRVESIVCGLDTAIRNVDRGSNYSSYNKKLFRKEFNWDENIIKYYKLFGGTKK
ncbi:glycosyltransferase family 4 protein [Candidatus Gracilibacteria bacterium]|nr:glycosyltransferase family 4 protein [Candidatus Gracilibacteria bacterium]